MRVYTDGSCRNGVGGWAWWCEDTEESRAGVESKSTNQRMELQAALEAVNEFFLDSELVIVSDSAYLVNCFGDKWYVKWFATGWLTGDGKDVANRDIWEPLLEIVESHGNVKFEWVKGHSGVKGNEIADALATDAVTAYTDALKKAAKKKEKKGAKGRNAEADQSGVSSGPDGGSADEDGNS